MAVGVMVAELAPPLPPRAVAVATPDPPVAGVVEMADVAGPRMPLLVADWVTVPVPLAPVGPELPDVACGLDVAVDEALPVSPVLVELALLSAEPDEPVMAIGLTVVVLDPPL